MNRLVSLVSPTMPALVAVAGDRAGVRVLESFASAIRNPHTRRAYARAAGDFLAWHADARVPSFIAVRPLLVAAWIDLQTETHSAPTVKQRLAAQLFDCLVTVQIVPVIFDPIHAKHGQKRFSNLFDLPRRDRKWSADTGRRNSGEAGLFADLMSDSVLGDQTSHAGNCKKASARDLSSLH